MLAFMPMPPLHVRQQRRRARIMLAATVAVLAQLTWGCHLPIGSDASVAIGEDKVQALIASAFCGTWPNSRATDEVLATPNPLAPTGHSPTDGTRSGGLCLHCTTSAEPASVTAIAWALAPSAKRTQTLVPPQPDANPTRITPPARAPPARA